MSKKAIVLHANILIRAVLGRRVRELIVDSADVVQFFAPDVANADTRKYLSREDIFLTVRARKVITFRPQIAHKNCQWNSPCLYLLQDGSGRI
jgi:hypothetical protein